MAEGAEYSLPLDFSGGYKPKTENFTKDSYEDESLSVKMEKRDIDGVRYDIAWIKVASPTQLRTQIAGEPNEAVADKPTKMARRVNAVVAINGDFYVQRKDGLIYRQGQAFRYILNPEKDILVIDDLGDMHVFLGGENQAAEPEETKEFFPVFNRYGLLLALSALAGLLIFFARNEKKTAHFAAALLAAAFGLLGARLFYAAANSKFYVLDIGVPMAMLRIWEGGLSLSGALVGAALGCCLGARLGKISAAQMLGQMAPGLMLFAAGARLAEMAVNAGFGMEMESSLWLLTREAGDGWRLNTALIMGIFDLLMMLLLFKMKEKQPGDRFWTGTFLYGVIHVLLESLRRDGHMQLGFVHVEQLFALLIALAALLVFAFRGKKVWLALLSTVILAGAVIGLEFALDRSNIHDGLLYIIYALLLIGYGRMGIYIAGQEKKMFRKERTIRA